MNCRAQAEAEARAREWARNGPFLAPGPSPIPPFTLPPGFSPPAGYVRLHPSVDAVFINPVAPDCDNFAWGFSWPAELHAGSTSCLGRGGTCRSAPCRFSPARRCCCCSACRWWPASCRCCANSGPGACLLPKEGDTPSSLPVFATSRCRAPAPCLLLLSPFPFPFSFFSVSRSLRGHAAETETETETGTGKKERETERGRAAAPLG